MLNQTLFPGARKPRGEGYSRRAEILSAAKRLFLAEGYERATIRKIAASVGVSSAALYLYFPDKDAILRGIAEDTFGALLVRLERVRQGPGDALERLRAGMLAYVAFGRDHPDEYRLTFLSKMLSGATPGRASETCPPESCKDIEAADRSFHVLLDMTAVLIESGRFRRMDPHEGAEVLWACMHGATALSLDHCDHLTTEIGKLAEAVVDTALRGMCRT